MTLTNVQKFLSIFLKHVKKFPKRGGKNNWIFEILLPKNIQYHEQDKNFPNTQGVINLT